MLTLTTFAELGIDQDIVDSLASKGIESAFPIQEQTIPLGLPGQDIIGQAKTGTGKTFGFGIPVVQRLGLDPEPVGLDLRGVFVGSEGTLGIVTEALRGEAPGPPSAVKRATFSA